MRWEEGIGIGVGDGREAAEKAINVEGRRGVEVRIGIQMGRSSETDERIP